MQNFYDREDGHGEEDDFGVIEGAEELLELNGGSDNEKIIFFYEISCGVGN